jgi:hypothetical protein
MDEFIKAYKRGLLEWYPPGWKHFDAGDFGEMCAALTPVVLVVALIIGSVLVAEYFEKKGRRR